MKICKFLFAFFLGHRQTFDRRLTHPAACKCLEASSFKAKSVQNISKALI